jgi:hypothetical protein
MWNGSKGDSRSAIRKPRVIRDFDQEKGGYDKGYVR